MEEPASTLHVVDGSGDPEQGNSARSSDRLRSTIAFPYSSLAEAERIAETLHRSWGGSASQDQIAGTLGTTPRNGTFRNKMAAARIFGAVSISRGSVKLTDLGNRLLDPKTQRYARVEAFMAVPLYSAIYREYEGRPLPPDEGLERKIAELGVSHKQTAKARQAMNSSAKLAGFFETDKTRLIRPQGVENSGSDSQGEREEEGQEIGQASPGTTTVPLGDLWLMLLNEGAGWSAEKTQDFVATARKLREVVTRDG